MQMVDIRFRHSQPSQESLQLIERRAEHLQKKVQLVGALTVVVEQLAHRHKKGNELSVRVEGRVHGGGRIITTFKCPADSEIRLAEAITEVFGAFESKALRSRTAPRSKALRDRTELHDVDSTSWAEAGYQVQPLSPEIARERRERERNRPMWMPH